MPFGDFFSKVDRIELTTADDRHFDLKNTPLSRLAFKILGVPHIGIRLRARNILRFVPKKKGMHMLDAGYGTGIYSFTLAPKMKKVTSVDLDSSKLSYVSSVNPYPWITFMQGNLNKLNFASNTFDLVVCSEVLEHIKTDGQAFSELARVLKKGGSLLITVPHISVKNNRFYRRYDHQRPGYNKKMIKELCLKNNVVLSEFKTYSNPITEKLFEFNEKLFGNPPILGLTFYPLYWIALLTEVFFRKKDPSGLFCKITKL